MACLVKCPICQKTKKLDSRTKHYFRCDWCHIAIEVKPNILGESFVLPRKCKDCGRIKGKDCDCIEIVDGEPEKLILVNDESEKLIIVDN